MIKLSDKWEFREHYKNYMDLYCLECSAYYMDGRCKHRINDLIDQGIYKKITFILNGTFNYCYQL